MAGCSGRISRRCDPDTLLKILNHAVDDRLNIRCGQSPGNSLGDDIGRRQTFVEDMSRDIQQSLTQLRADIANKEQTIQQIAAARQAVAEALAGL